jgi:ABC-type multidrug transport system permease subunit
MQLADRVARQAPYLQVVNPVKQVSNLFYSLYFYDSYGPFVRALTILLVMAAVLFAFALILMRRQRYASV